MITSQDIKKIFLFSDLNSKELQLINDISVISVYSKGEILFFDTEPYQGFYGVIRGLVKIYKISKEGREHIIHLEYSGSTFAEVPLFERADLKDTDFLTYPANAMALEDNTIVIKTHIKPFLEFTKNNPGICLKLLSSLAKRLRFLNSHIESMTLDDVSRRLSKYLLLEIEKEHPDAEKSNTMKENLIELDIARYDLASYLGTITETLSRSLRKLQSEDIIEVNGKTIIIRDLTALKKLAK